MRQLYGALRDLVIQNPGGWDDLVTRSRVQALCQEAQAAVADAECHERLRAVERQSAELYSDEQHRKWDRKSMSGADYLRLQILISLEALNTRLFFLQALRDRAQSVLVAERAATDTP